MDLGVQTKCTVIARTGECEVSDVEYLVPKKHSQCPSVGIIKELMWQSAVTQARKQSREKSLQYGAHFSLKQHFPECDAWPFGDL